MVDELLLVEKEEGGIPPRHFSLSDLEEAVVGCEAFSLLHTVGTMEGDAMPHTDVDTIADVKLVLFLARNALVQATTLAEEVAPRGEDEEEHPVVLGLRQLVLELDVVQSRRVVTAGSFFELVKEMSGEEGGQGLKDVVGKMMGATTALEQLLEGEGLLMEGGTVLEDLRGLREEVGQALSKWIGAGLVAMERSEVWSIVRPQTQEGAGDGLTPCTVRARKLKRRLVEAVELQPLLEAAKEAENKLGQVQWRTLVDWRERLGCGGRDLLLISRLRHI